MTATAELLTTHLTLPSALPSEVRTRARVAGVDVSVHQGERGTVLVLFSGAALALVQPERRTAEAYRIAAHDAKADLIKMLRNQPQRTVGIVYLPRNTKIRRSGAGAAQMGKHGLTYEVETGTGRNQVDNALTFIRRWGDEARVAAEHFDSFAAKLLT
jgi:hypothetical protein